MISGLRMIEDDLTGTQIAALLQLHLDEMYAWSPPESVHAMPLDRLRAPDVKFFSAWDGDRLTGCGAIKQVDPGHGEIKSMRAAPEYRGKGIGAAVLLHLLQVARDRGYARVSLETGTQPEFAPARKLYIAHGFSECPPFGDYRLDPLSVFMTLEL